MERVCVTEGEIVEALREALSGASGDEGLTTEEMTAATGIGTKRLRTALRKLKESGRLEVGRRRITSISGAQCFIPVYRVRP